MRYSFPDKKALVVGAGGLGGYVVEHLARSGISVTVMDGDVFSASNMNRQLYCVKTNFGQNKAEIAAKRAVSLGVEAKAIAANFDVSTATEISNVDVVVDCVDNITTRRLLVDECAKYGKPLFHAAINGDYGHIAQIMPGDNVFDKLYPDEDEPKISPTYSVVPCVVASLETNLVLKYFDGEKPMKGVMIFDAAESTINVLRV